MENILYIKDSTLYEFYLFHFCILVNAENQNRKLLLSIFCDASSLYYPPLNWIPFKYDIIFVNWIQLCWKKLNWICKYYILCVGCGFELCIYVYGISNAALTWIIKIFFPNSIYYDHQVSLKSRLKLVLKQSFFLIIILSQYFWMCVIFYLLVPKVYFYLYNVGLNCQTQFIMIHQDFYSTIDRAE